MRFLFALLLIAAALCGGYYVAWERDTGPARKVARLIEETGPHCLVCERTAAGSVTYSMAADRLGPNSPQALRDLDALTASDEHFCHLHAPPEELQVFITAKIDRYFVLLTSAALCFGVIAIGFWGAMALMAGKAAGLGAVPFGLLVGWFATFVSDGVNMM